MKHFVAIESSSGRVIFVQNVLSAEAAYEAIGREIYNMPDPIDTGNVDVDLYEVPGHYTNAVECVVVQPTS